MSRNSSRAPVRGANRRIGPPRAAGRQRQAARAARAGARTTPPSAAPSRVRQHRIDTAPVAAGSAARSARSRTALATHMSRHIVRMAFRQPREIAQSGSCDAPVIGGVRSGRRGSPINANASRCGRWLTAESSASCRSAVSRLTIPPHCVHHSRTRSTAPDRFPRSGVSTTWRPRNSDADAAAAPERFAARDRVPGTKRDNAAAERAYAPRRSRPAWSLPASLTIVPGPRCGAIAANSRRHFADRCGQQHQRGVGELRRPALVPRVRPDR